MKKLLLFILITSLVTTLNAFATSNPPKREFRGAWIATVANIDWPSAPGINSQSQRGELIRILDELKDTGISAVFFQIRPEGDALYASTIEPWSFWLTGQQGQNPNPFYDPLEFAITEAHKRGMELHAWINPYWVVRNTNNHSIAPNHVSVRHPEWILTFPAYPSGLQKWLDPGLPEVRSYITSVIIDVVRRYDVDGVHFDDYFYVYPDSRINLPLGISNQDDATFKNYSRGFADRGNWRRDNVNLLVKMVHDSVQTIKAQVKFGISPFGIWRNGVPAGISGMDAYNVIYADPLAWLNQKTVDYIVPQLYWPFGGGQDYGKLMPWWASQTNGRHFYIGQAAYRIATWAANEMPRQIRLNRNTTNALGSIFFRARDFRENPKGFTDSLKTDLYRYPALSPVMSWKDTVLPNPPQNLRFERLAGTGAAGLRWDIPNIASDGDTASRYVVYRFDQSAIPPSALDDPSKIIAIEGGRLSMPKTPPATGSYYYVVTSLDRNSNESAGSTALLILPPSAPLLASPANGAIANTAQIALRWFYPDNASSYRLQVALDSTFATPLLVNEAGIADTFKIVSGLVGQQRYYWRVQASNPSGAGTFSRLGIFTTGFPAVVALVAPSNNVRDVPARPTLTWRTAPGAGLYHLQVASTALFDSVSTVYDITGIADTAYQASQLEGDKFYFWRVRAKNAIGESNWSATWRFKTVIVTAVAEATTTPPKQFQLYQNYPNPFNPITTIVFDLPQAGTPQLVIFDALGRELLALVDEPMAAGRHTVQFDASPLPSGVYYYRLNFAGRILTRRMTILK
jgi:uncharacterized lipoprotein YddW (UPF0748 family)